ncbi:hypothetical protein QBC39DRAFT_347388 [Podospora conica]|nr:hypothetical protein QBC39DRAFT_347388 [Schizothecium conicum]
MCHPFSGERQALTIVGLSFSMIGTLLVYMKGLPRVQWRRCSPFCHKGEEEQPWREPPDQGQYGNDTVDMLLLWMLLLLLCWLSHLPLKMFGPKSPGTSHQAGNGVAFISPASFSIFHGRSSPACRRCRGRSSTERLPSWL